MCTETPVLTRTRVLLVEDHPIVREGMVQLINDEADLLVCGEASDTAEALDAVRNLHPDVAVVDLSLKDRSGMDVIKEIRQIDLDLPILVLSMHDESLQAERALRAGARGYIMKHEATEKVLTAIRRVLAGEVYLSERMSTRMLQKLVDTRKSVADSPLESLTNRELEIFTMMGQGVGPRDIAARLSLSLKTVEAHRDHIKQKLNIKTSHELIRHAMQYAMDQRT